MKRVRNIARSFFRTFSGLFLLLVLTSHAYGEANPPTVNLPLKAALAMAIRNNLDLRVDALDSSMAGSSLKRSKSIYDPYLSLTANYDKTFYPHETFGDKGTSTYLNLTQYLPTGGSLSANTQAGQTKYFDDPVYYDYSDWSTSAGLTLSQPLLKNFGRESMELGITLAANDHEDSLEQFRESVTDTVYDVIKSYHRLYTLRQIQTSREQALKSAQKLLADLTQKQMYGVQQDVEVSNTQYAISQRLRELVDAESNVKNEEARLRYLIGEESRAVLIPTDPPSGAEPLETTEQAITLAMEMQSDLRQLRLDLRAAELRERVSKRKLLPNLSVNASAGFRGNQEHFRDSVDELVDGKGRWWSAGLQFSTSLGNTAAKGDYRRDKLQTKQIKNRLTAAEWKYRDAIEADMRTLMSARIQKQVANESLKFAETRLEQYRKSLSRKQSKIQDLLNAENDLTYAQNQLTEALERFANAVARLWKNSGVLLERQKIHINTRQPEDMTTGTLQLPSPETNMQPLVARESAEEILRAATRSLPVKVIAPALVPGGAQVLTAVTAKPPVPPVKKSNQVAAPAAMQSAAIANDQTGRVKTATYTLKIGDYISSELATTKKKIVTAGLQPSVETGARQQRLVFRLKAGDYLTHTAANKRLQGLRKVKIDGFIVKKGKAVYRLYAGSFFSREAALKELRRLASFGLALDLEKATVRLPTSVLTAGRFASRDAAQAGAMKLEKMGIKSIIQKIPDQT